MVLASQMPLNERTQGFLSRISGVIVANMGLIELNSLTTAVQRADADDEFYGSIETELRKAADALEKTALSSAIEALSDRKVRRELRARADCQRQLRVIADEISDFVHHRS